MSGEIIATAEQKMAIGFMNTGGDTKVQAPAGSGKTWLLKKGSSSMPERRGTYLAFNKAIADEAKDTFPRNVECRTGHSLAFGAVGRKYAHRLKPLPGFKLAQEYDIGATHMFPTKTAKGYLILDTIRNFCFSNDDELGVKHVPYLGKKITDIDLLEFSYQELPIQAQKIMSLMMDENENIPITHDLYLKMWALGKPKINKDFLLFDECITGDHKVKTNNGVIAIQSLYEKHKNNKKLPLVKSFNQKKEIYEYKKITGALKSKNRNIYKVETEGRNILTGTSNHPILTQRGYIEIKNLKIGVDYIYLDSPEKQKTKWILNEDQKQIVIGSFLGDGHLAQQSKYPTYRLKFSHGIKQIEYLKTKMDIFGITKIQNGISGYTGRKDIFGGVTNTFLLEKEIWKTVEDITAKGLAIWFMDDGSIGNETKTIFIHSNSFSYEQHEYLQKIVKNKFGIDLVIYETRGFYAFRANVEMSQKFINIIKPYIHNDLRYKIQEKDDIPEYQWDSEYKPYGGNFVSKITNIGKQNVYDITVEDNHNFITMKSYYSSGIIVHNCQDANPVILGVMQNQTHMQKIFVGDQYQQIYGWRGALNAMKSVPHEHSTHLSQSFRFGQAIAGVANDILQKYTPDDEFPIKIIGNPNRHSVVEEIEGCPDAIICRTNGGVISQVFNYIEDYKVYLQGGATQLVSLIKGAQALKEGRKTANQELALFNTWEEVVDYSKSSSDGKALGVMIKLLDTYGANTLMDLLKQTVSSPRSADITLTTGHKAKGLEWGKVKLGNDFFYPEKEGQLLNSGEVNILYVSATRALNVLDISDCRAAHVDDVLANLQEA